MTKLFSLLLIIFSVSCQTVKEKSTTLSNRNNINIDYSKVSQTTESTTRLKNICNQKFPETWDKLVNVANSCIKNKKQDQLLKVATKLSLDYPKMPWGEYYKSVYFYNKKMNLKALWLIDNVIQKNNNVGVFKYHKSRILYNLNYLNASKNEATQAVKLDSNNYSALLFIAQLQLESTDFKQAIDYAKQAEVIKKTEELRLLFGEAYFANKQYKKALSYFKKIDQNNAKIIFKMAYSYEQLENMNKAISLYKKVPSKLKTDYANNYNIDLNEKIKEFEDKLSSPANRIPSQKKETKKND